MVKMGLLMSIMVFYLPTITILLYYKQTVPRNEIEEMELNQRVFIFKKSVLYFAISYVKTALRKIGISGL
ncbi:hypothetical protein AGMMS49579_17530 [Spirochaetia bacterium]|nr:hypothetical protein AGMMS49579_17530 [Spirochaetia bacterium]